MAHSMIAPGVRVARGPDWSWQNQGARYLRPRKYVSHSRLVSEMELIWFLNIRRRWRRSHRNGL